MRRRRKQAKQVSVYADFAREVKPAGRREIQCSAVRLEAENEANLVVVAYGELE